MHTCRRYRFPRQHLVPPWNHLGPVVGGLVTQALFVAADRSHGLKAGPRAATAGLSALYLEDLVYDGISAQLHSSA